MAAKPQLLFVIHLTVATFSLAHASSYSLTSSECKATVQSIGKALGIEKTKYPVAKGTWVSPRCEVRRVQDAYSKGEKTSFLLRMFEIPNRRKWTGNYFFYQDKDCREPTYGLEVQGELTIKGHDIKFNFSAVKIATYRPDVDKSFQKIYNRSCLGHLRPTTSQNINTLLHIDKNVATQRECLKALGVGPEEFSNAFFKSHSNERGKVEELFLRSVDLRRTKERSGSSKNVPPSYQWPLSRHDSLMCLTCARVGMGKLKHPPRLSTRNSTSIDGAWGSANCHHEDRVYSSRFDRFVGNTFETTVFASYNSLCHNPDFELQTKGTLRKVSNSAEVPGGVVYEMAVRQAFLTAYTKSIASVLNLPGSCGQHTWEKGKTQDLVPTKGCDTIGYALGPPELVLIRAVRDENRNELYFGIDPYGRRQKDGPVSYNYISQGCTNFPVAVSTPKPTEEITTAPFDLPENYELLSTPEKSSVPITEVLALNIPTDGSPSLKGIVTSIIACFLVFLLARRMV